MKGPLEKSSDTSFDAQFSGTVLTALHRVYCMNLLNDHDIFCDGHSEALKDICLIHTPKNSQVMKKCPERGYQSWRIFVISESLGDAFGKNVYPEIGRLGISRGQTEYPIQEGNWNRGAGEDSLLRVP